MGKKKVLFGRPAGPVIIPNTFIGGLGSRLPDAQSLSMYLSISTKHITGYEVDINNNITCRITKVYTIDGGFSNWEDLLYYVDLEGLCVDHYGSVLYNNVVCTSVYFPVISTLGADGGLTGFSSMPLRNYLVLAGLTRTVNKFANNFTELKVMSLPLATHIGVTTTPRNSFSNLTSLERLYIPNVTSYSWYYAVTTLFANLNSGCVIYVNPTKINQANAAYTKFKLNSLQIDVPFYFNGLAYTPVTIKVNPGDFLVGNPTQNGQRLAAEIAIDTRIGILYDVRLTQKSGVIALISTVGGVTSNDITFDVSSQPGIEILNGNNPNHLENGEDGLHPALRYAQDTRGAIIRSVDNNILPDKPTNLSSSNLTATSVDLFFTPPTPNVNGTDGYEVWIDDGKTPYLAVLPYAELLNSGDTLDLTGYDTTGLQIKVRTFDGLYNLSEFSETIIL